MKTASRGSRDWSRCGREGDRLYVQYTNDVAPAETIRMQEIYALDLLSCLGIAKARVALTCVAMVKGLENLSTQQKGERPDLVF